MKKEKFLLSNINTEIKISKWKGPMFVPIPLVKTLGLLYHSFINKNRVYILFKKEMYTMHLVLIISSSDTSIKVLGRSINSLISFAREIGTKEIKSIIVNPRLTNDIMTRYGWEYMKDNWYIGKHYKYKL